MLARLATPTSVPTVSKKSTKKKVSIITQNSGFAIIEKSIFINIGEIEGGIETNPAGIFVMPKGIPAMVTAIIPISMPPVI